MNFDIHRLTVALALLTLPACKSNATIAAAAEPGSAAPSASVASSAAPPSATPSAPIAGPQSPLAVPGATVATLPNMSFAERFALEAKGRPHGITPTAEEVYAKLKTAGLEVVDVKQHLAAPQGARFCLGARAVGPNKETRLDLSVCEYATPEVARMGRDYSAESMKAVIPNRTVYVNKQTTLIVREDQKTPEIDALVDAASAAFAKL